MKYIFKRGLSLVFAMILLCSIAIPTEAKTFTYIAHRGDMADVPENTTAAIAKAKENGYKWVEMDLIESNSHCMIISHDYDLKRMCKKNISVKKLTSKNYKVPIKNLKKWKGKALTIINLDTALKECKKKGLRLCLHVKLLHKKQNCVKSMLKKIKSAGMTSKTVIFTSNESTLKNIRSVQKKLKYKGFVYGFLTTKLTSSGYTKAFNVAKKNGCKYLFLNYGNVVSGESSGHMASSSLIKKIHKAKISVFAYPIGVSGNLSIGKNEVKKLMNRGYDGALCNKKLFDIKTNIAPGITVDPTPVDPTPIEPTPVEPTPVDPTPVDPAPVSPDSGEGTTEQSEVATEEVVIIGE